MLGLGQKGQPRWSPHTTKQAPTHAEKRTCLTRNPGGGGGGGGGCVCVRACVVVVWWWREKRRREEGCSSLPAPSLACSPLLTDAALLHLVLGGVAFSLSLVGGAVFPPLPCGRCGVTFLLFQCFHFSATFFSLFSFFLEGSKVRISTKMSPNLEQVLGPLSFSRPCRCTSFAGSQNSNKLWALFFFPFSVFRFFPFHLLFNLQCFSFSFSFMCVICSVSLIVYPFFIFLIFVQLFLKK